MMPLILVEYGMLISIDSSRRRLGAKYAGLGLKGLRQRMICGLKESGFRAGQTGVKSLSSIMLAGMVRASRKKVS